MTGILTWIGAGLAAGLLARLVARRRTPLWLEVTAAIAAALAAGLLATALDFGGIATLDLRSALFALLAGAAAVAAVRVLR